MTSPIRNANALSRAKVTALQVAALISAVLAAVVPQLESVEDDADPWIVGAGLVATLLTVLTSRANTTPVANPQGIARIRS